MLGSGRPVTVLAHGLAGSASETRPLAARIPGTRVLLTFRGHGGSDDLVGGWTYDDLASDLVAVADACDATGGVGLSMGAGALLRLCSQQPSRFERLAFVLPATLDRERDPADPATQALLQLAAAVTAGDSTRVAALLLAEVPPQVRNRSGVRLLVERRSRQLLLRPPPYPRGGDVPLPDPTSLSRVLAPALVLGQHGDALHPAAVAVELAQHLPRADLLLLGAGGVFWTDSRRAQNALATHLAPEST